ncbi:MAG TPA: glycosyltransferase family 2 protein [Syntrophomonadaceae bacterium]|nr:glycosyltransferase family 2 protein [Syntrophomonadaceae bacterium]
MRNRIMIGCPVRNRGWALPDYLHHLTRMDYPLTQMELCFIVNDSDDDTLQILKKFGGQFPGKVKLLENNSVNPSGYQRGYYSFTRLAELRNLLLQEFLSSSCTHLFSLDSDILAPREALTLLLEDHCNIVSALVCNGHLIGDRGIFNLLYQDSCGNYRHLRDFPRGRLFPVDCTGAACLIERAVIEEHGVRYGSARGAEDIEFCEKARSQGLDIFCDSRVECIHRM